MDSRPSRRSVLYASLLALSLSSVILTQGCSTLVKAFQLHHLEPATISDSPILIRAIRLEDWKKADSLVASRTGIADHAFDGSSALSLAAKAGRESLVRAILATKTSTPFDGELALIEAASAGHGAIVDILVDAGFKVGSKKGYDILVQKRSLEALRLLVRAPDPSYKVSLRAGTGIGPVLPWAAAKGDAGLVKEFLRQGAKPDQASDQVMPFASGTPALWVAAFYNHPENLRLLLDAGAKIEEGDYSYGFSPLMAAAITGSLESARLLVEAGAKVGAYSKTSRMVDFKVTDLGDKLEFSRTDLDLKQRTPLMLAAEQGRAEMVRYLVSAGAVVDAKNDDGITAHDAARAANHPEIAELLRSLGSAGTAGSAPVEAPILAAIFAYTPEAVKTLLPKLEDAYTGKRLIEPLTAAVLALRRAENVKDKTTQALFRTKAYESLRLLLGVKDRIPEFDRSWALRHAAYSPTLLAELVDAGVKGDFDAMFETADALATAGLEPQFKKCVASLDKPMKKEQVNTLLFSAAFGGNTAILGYLIELGAEPNPGNFWVKNFGTPLGAAALSGKIDAMRFLQEKGAEVDPKLASQNNFGALPQVNPLMEAATGGKIDAAKYLVAAGATLDGVSLWGFTALSYAVSAGNADVTRFLLDSGADPNLRMNPMTMSTWEMRGETALMQAARAGELDCVKALLAKGADPRLTDWNGDDALLMAREAGHDETAAALKTALGDLYR